MNFLNKKKNKGFMVVEILIAIFIISIAIISFTNVAQKSISLSKQSLNTFKASLLLEEGMEVVKAFRDSSWDNIADLVPNTKYFLVFDPNTSSWTFTTTPTTTDGFTREIILSDVYRDAVTSDIDPNGILDTGTKLVRITVYWQEGGQTVTKNLEAYISNIFS